MIKAMKAGRNEMAPNFSLFGTDGKQYSLEDSLKSGHQVLLVFLRHLG